MQRRQDFCVHGIDCLKNFSLKLICRGEIPDLCILALTGNSLVKSDEKGREDIILP